MPQKSKPQGQRPQPKMGGPTVRRNQPGRPQPRIQGPYRSSPRPNAPQSPFNRPPQRPNYPPGPMPPNRRPPRRPQWRPGGQPNGGGPKVFNMPAAYQHLLRERSMGAGRSVGGPAFPQPPGGQLRTVPGGVPQMPQRPSMGASSGAPQMPVAGGVPRPLPVRPQPVAPDQYMQQFTDPRDIYKAQFENRARWATGSLTPQAQQYVFSTPFYVAPNRISSYNPGTNAISFNNASPYLMQHEYSHGLGWNAGQNRSFPSGFDSALQQYYGDGRDPVEWYAFMAQSPSFIPSELRQFFPQFKPSVYGP